MGGKATMWRCDDFHVIDGWMPEDEARQAEHGSEELAFLSVNVLSDGGGLDGYSTMRLLDRQERRLDDRNGARISSPV
jgi:hypothetical protein